MKLIASFIAFIFVTVLLFLQFSSFNKPIENSEEVTKMVDSFIQSTPSLPRYMEGGYSPLGRSPVVDVLLADPFYLPTYAETVEELIKNNSEQGHLFALETALFTAAGIPVSSLNEEEILQFNQDVPDRFQEAFPPLIAQKLHAYWQTFIKTQHEVESILSTLSEDEKNWIRKNYNIFFFESQDQEAKYNFFTSESANPLKFFKLASKLDLAKLADCSRKLSLIADDFYKSKEEFSTLTLENDFVWEENNLKFIVSQKSHTTHEENADFFIDLGGFNTILTNAGGTEGTRALALHIDLKGNNTYQGKNFVQGSGFLGVGLLVNCSGNNTYHADSYSQGSGFFGVGLLVNSEGNNNFVLNFGGQSFALFGSSILWNKEGKNSYLAEQGMAQAASSTLGVAFLVDNQGDNSYKAGESGKGGTRFGGIGQGGSSGTRAFPWLNNPSLYGGLSFLYIGGGGNTLKTAWLGQGSAYFLGAGITVAEGSNNVFEADYDAQGQGLHMAAGLLLQKGEHGTFKGGWGSLGVSGDRSVGMFIGIGGNNTYEGTDQSVGSSRKPKSVGVFINIGGQNTYKFKKLSNARLQFPQSPKEWSSALFLEMGADSQYPENIDEFKRGNNLKWGIKNHSLGVSSEFEDKNPEEALFAKFHASPHIYFPFNPNTGWEGNTAYRPLEVDPRKAQDLANEIATANYDRRRQIYEILDLLRFQNRKSDYDLSYLLKIPTQIEEDAFNYAVLWALRNKEKTDLKAIKSALASGGFTSEYSRKMAVSLVGTFWTPDDVPLLSQIMLKDKSEEIRYYAALALALNLSNESIAAIKEGLKSDSEIVRYAIARGLQEGANPSSLSLVIPLFDDKSFYVRRAAGMTAISLGDRTGIPVVLETLKYETLDTDDNYGDNIYAQLSTYLGVDFRLDKKAWLEWWSKSKDNFQFPAPKGFE